MLYSTKFQPKLSGIRLVISHSCETRNNKNNIQLLLRDYKKSRVFQPLIIFLLRLSIQKVIVKAGSIGNHSNL